MSDTPSYTKTCEVCNREFTARHFNVKVCDSCREEAAGSGDNDFLPSQRQIWMKSKFWEARRSGKECPTMSDALLADMTGIPETTVSRWKRKPGFLTWLQDSTDIDGLAKGYAELALKTLANQLTGGTARARTDAAKAILAYQKLERKHITVDDISEKSDEEVDKEVENLLKLVNIDD